MLSDRDLPSQSREQLRNSTSTPRIEMLPIGSLRPNPRNARKHSTKQIEQIVQSIRRLGFLNPILVDDNNLILAGHGRLAAALLLGLKHIPVILFFHLTNAQKRAYLIADR